MTAAATTAAEVPDASHLSSQLHAWAVAIEAGVLARAAREDPSVSWRGDATEEELCAVELLGARAQQELVAANLGLVGSVVSGHVRGGGSVADLFQEGCLGLIAAVERFDHRRGVRFSTYAVYWIRTCVSTAGARLAQAVTLPASRSEQLRSARGVEGALTQQLGRLPSTTEVAHALGRDERWTAGLLGHGSARSIDELDDRALHRCSPVSGGPGEGWGPDPETWAPRLLATLDGFDRRVLELRMGFGRRAPASLASVARELCVPVGRVRRAEVRALELLRSRCPWAVAAEAAS